MTGPAIAFLALETDGDREVLLFLALEEEDLDALDARFRLGESPGTELRDLGFRDGRLDLLFQGADGGRATTPLAAFLEARRALAELVYVSEGRSVWGVSSEDRVRRPTFVLRLELSDPRCRGRVVSWAWCSLSTRIVTAEGRGES